MRSAAFLGDDILPFCCNELHLEQKGAHLLAPLPLLETWGVLVSRLLTILSCQEGKDLGEPVVPRLELLSYVCCLYDNLNRLTIGGLLSNNLYLHVFFWGHNSHGSPQPAPMVQQHTDFLIWRVLGVVHPFSSNFSKQKPMRESVCNWKMN